jgi:hypothetical protein
MSLENAIVRAFEKKEVRGWDKWPRMFWAIDLHDVIIPGTYTRNNENRQLYPFADEVLKWITNREDMCPILYTSSHKDSIDDILTWLYNNYDIKFDYVNCNPECENHNLCDFSQKFYMDILLDDKAGFDGMQDWLEIKNVLVKMGEWDKKESH